VSRVLSLPLRPTRVQVVHRVRLGDKRGSSDAIHSLIWSLAQPAMRRSDALGPGFGTWSTTAWRRASHCSAASQAPRVCHVLSGISPKPTFLWVRARTSGSPGAMRYHPLAIARVGYTIRNAATRTPILFSARSLSITLPSEREGPPCRGGKCTTPSEVLAAPSPGCCAPARTPLGTTRLPVGLPPRLPKGPGFAPTTPTRTRPTPTSRGRAGSRTRRTAMPWPRIVGRALAPCKICPTATPRGESKQKTKVV
jgi:hypothetical protein